MPCPHDIHPPRCTVKVKRVFMSSCTCRQATTSMGSFSGAFFSFLGAKKKKYSRGRRPDVRTRWTFKPGGRRLGAFSVPVDSEARLSYTLGRSECSTVVRADAPARCNAGKQVCLMPALSPGSFESSRWRIPAEIFPGNHLRFPYKLGAGVERRLAPSRKAVYEHEGTTKSRF